MRISLFVLALAIGAPAFADTPAAPPRPGADKDKLICKRETPVGSLIASRKVCLTKEQWVQREADGNREARKMVEDNTGRPTGN